MQTLGFLVLLWLLFRPTIARVVDNECVYTDIKEKIYNVKFDNATQICCDGGVYQKTQDTIEVKCCGENTYRPVKEFCCNGKVYPKDSGTKCCRCKKNNFWGYDENSCKEEVYSLKTHVCFGHVIEMRFIRHFSRLLRTLRYPKLRNTNIHIDRACFRKPILTLYPDK